LELNAIVSSRAVVALDLDLFAGLAQVRVVAEQGEFRAGAARGASPWVRSLARMLMRLMAARNGRRSSTTLALGGARDDQRVVGEGRVDEAHEEVQFAGA
jgi:hypothetical protein